MTTVDTRRHPGVRQAASRDLNPLVELLAAVSLTPVLGITWSPTNASACRSSGATSASSSPTR
jgi:hypothetical protein